MIGLVVGTCETSPGDTDVHPRWRKPRPNEDSSWCIHNPPSPSMFLKLPGDSHVWAGLRTTALSVKTNKNQAVIILLLFLKVDICTEEKRLKGYVQNVTRILFEWWDYIIFYLCFPWFSKNLHMIILETSEENTPPKMLLYSILEYQSGKIWHLILPKVMNF